VTQLGRTIPALPVVEIPAAVSFYRDRLGFDEVHAEDGFAIVRRDAAEIHLWAASDRSWQAELDQDRPIRSGAESFLAGTASCRIEVEGIDALYDEYRTKEVVYGPDTVVEDTWWGTSEFPALDLHRNLLTFFETRGNGE